MIRRNYGYYQKYGYYQCTDLVLFPVQTDFTEKDACITVIGVEIETNIEQRRTNKSN